MIVCSCNRLTECAVRDAADGLPAGSGPAKVYRALGCGPKCGRCADTLRAILSECGGARTAPVVAASERDAA